MMLPTPDDLGRAPAWENYIIAQVTQASLGLIPRSAVALGVEVDRYDVTLRCQLRQLTDEDADDLSEITEELATLVGDKIRVRWLHEICEQPRITPHDHTQWTFVARQ